MSFLFGSSVLAQSIYSSPKSSSLSLNLRSNQYVSENQNYFREGAEGNISSVGIGIDEKAGWRKLEGKLQLKNEFSAAENWNYLNVYEVYGGLRKGPDVAIGRKKEKWTDFEQAWNLGLFQPRYTQDKLRPEAAGLTGLFWNQALGKNAQFTLAYLPIHIPDFGAHFYVKEHRFTSENPWFKPPASQFIYREQSGDIRYTLNKPEVGDVLFNQGIAAKIDWRAGAFRSRLAYAYKPMPQFLLGFPSRKRVVIAEESAPFMNVEINARLTYHRVTSWENAADLGPWRVEGGVAHENPVAPDAPEDWTAASVRPAWIWTAGVSRALEEDGPRAARIHLGYLRVDGGDYDDVGDFATSGDTLFEPRYTFRQAVQVGVSKPWRGWFKYPLESEARLIYDRPQNGGVAQFNLGLNIQRDLRADFLVEFLGLLGGEARVRDGFLATYRANDRVGLGVTYAF